MIQAALIALIAFLAYMGDAVMSLLVREMLLAQGWQKSKILQKKSESWVSAKAQAYFLIQLKERAFFSEEEYAIVLRGRNTHSASKAKKCGCDNLPYVNRSGGIIRLAVSDASGGPSEGLVGGNSEDRRIPMTQYVYGKNVVKQLLQDGKPIHEVLIQGGNP